MTDEHNPRSEPGDNKPPENAPDPLAARLELEHAGLVAEAAALEMRAFELPEEPKTDEECASLQDFALAAKRVIKKAEGAHTDEKAPYLASGRTVDAFFKSVWTPMEARVKAVEGRINAFVRAKAARERAEREERARQEREAAEAAARAEREAREAAQRAEREAQEAAERIRLAANKEERDKAAAEMLNAEQEAASNRAAAEEAGRDAAAAGRVAAVHEKAAAGGVGALGKVTSEGSSLATSTFWNHRIKDADKLVESLGPLGPHFTNDAIQSAIGVAKRAAIAAGKIGELSIPGVEFFEDSKSTVRSAR